MLKMMKLDAADWRNLELLNENSLLLDIPQAASYARLPQFIRLYEAGYCTLVETGPGDSVHIFAISEAGKTALAERRGNSA